MMRWNLHIALLLVTALLLGNGCRRTDPPTPDPIDFSEGVLLANEGNFTWGNASLSFVDAEGTIHQNVFETKTKRPLGDVAQSLYLYRDQIYVVVNNSGKIERMARNLDTECAITGLISPREMAFISPTKAYVTDLYASAISIVNPSECSLSGEIRVNGWTEAILSYQDKVYAAGYDAGVVYVIDPGTDQVIDSLETGEGPVSMGIDANGLLWVLCSGGLNVAPPRLQQFDLSDQQLLRDFVIADSSRSPSQLCLDPTREFLYFLDGNRIFRQPITATSFLQEVVYEGNDELLYALEVDPVTGDLYVTDAIDYVQAGRLLRINPTNGQVTTEWTTGVIPGDMLFLR